MLARALCAARVRLGASQEAVALAAGIAVTTYRDLEVGHSRNGGLANPRLDTIVRVFQVLEIDLTELQWQSLAPAAARTHPWGSVDTTRVPTIAR